MMFNGVCMCGRERDRVHDCESGNTTILLWQWIIYFETNKNTGRQTIYIKK